MASDGTEILIEALKAAVTRLDDARTATDALQGALRAAETRESHLSSELSIATAQVIDLGEQVGALNGSLDAAHRRIAEAEADRDRLRRVTDSCGPIPRFNDYAAQVPR